MTKEIRTERGKLVGVYDEIAGQFCIKDRGKETVIEVPPCGLRLRHTPGDGKIEEVYIPAQDSLAPRADKPQVA